MDAKNLVTIKALSSANGLAADGLRLGYSTETGAPVDIPDADLLRHSHILSPAGAGGEALCEYLLAQQIARGGGFLYVDSRTDGQVGGKARRLMKAFRRSDELFRMDLDAEDTHTYNPLYAGRPDEIANRLMCVWKAGTAGSDETYERQQCGYALLVILDSLRAAKRYATLQDLAMLLASKRGLEYLRGLPLDETHRNYLDTLGETLGLGEPGSTAMEGPLRGIAEVAKFYSHGKFGRLMNTYTPDVVLQDVVENQHGLVLSMPAGDRLKPARDITTMVLHDLRCAVMKLARADGPTQGKPPFLVVLPDLSSYWNHTLLGLLDQARAANVAIVVAHRGLDSASELGALDFSRSAVMATRTRVAFRQPPEDARGVADKLTRWSARAGITVGAGDTSVGVSADTLQALSRRQAIVQRGTEIQTVTVPSLWLEGADTVGHEPSSERTPLRLADSFQQFLRVVME